VHLFSDRARLAMAARSGGPRELREQAEQQKNGVEGRHGGVEWFHAEAVRAEIMFQFGDAILHVGAPVGIRSMTFCDGGFRRVSAFIDSVIPTLFPPA
jgi:hypothetical protein